MHNIPAVCDRDARSLVPITQWVRPIVMRHLPYSTNDANKIVKELIRVHSKDLEMIDFFSNYYLPYKWTPLEEHIAYQIGLMARNFTKTFRTNFSPFQPGRRRVDRGTLNNPSMTGQSSTSSANSSDGSSAEEESVSDVESMAEVRSNNVVAENTVPVAKRQSVRFPDLFRSMQDVYGCSLREPNAADMLKYKRYVKIGKTASPSVAGAIASRSSSKSVNLSASSDYGFDCYEGIATPQVSKESLDIYERYVNLPSTIQTEALSNQDALLIRSYVATLQV